jgi:hypothetical protein
MAWVTDIADNGVTKIPKQCMMFLVPGVQWVHAKPQGLCLLKKTLIPTITILQRINRKINNVWLLHAGQYHDPLSKLHSDWPQKT